LEVEASVVEVLCFTTLFKMARRYDQGTTTFSQQGRLYQVEYAVEATKEAGPAIGILGADCVILAGEKKTASKLLDQGKQPEKIFEIDDHVCCAVAGVTSDANTLINKIRLYAQQYTYRFGDPIPLEQLVANLCDYKQGYTQIGGLRPFGVSFLAGGYDRHFGFQLYHTDPAGVYSGWKAHAIGSLANVTTDSILKADWKEGMTQAEVKKLIAKVLMKGSDTNSPDGEKYEWALVERTADGRIRYKRLTSKEVEELLKEAAKEKEAEEAAKK